MSRTSIVLAGTAALALLASARPAAAQECRSPDVILTLDASGSMRAAVGASSRWAIAVDGLTALTRANDGSVRWGLVVYPSDAICGPGDPVAPLPSSGEEVSARLAAAIPGGGTPTATSVDAAAALFAAVRSDRPQYHVLVTDGDANCNVALDPATCTCTCTPGPTCDCAMRVNCLDDVATEAAVAALAAQGVPTFVIGFFGDPSVEVLNRLATAGGTATDGEEKFIRVRGPEEFVSALGALEGLVGVQKRACSTPCGAGIERCTEERGWIGCDATLPGAARGCAVAGESIGFQRCEADGWGPCVGEEAAAEEGCGCGAGRGGPMRALPWLFALVGLAARRRR